MRYLNIIYFAAVIMLLTACNDDKSEITPEVDMSLSRKVIDDDVNLAYSTFYKPAYAVTGDAMPYYNESDQTFYMYFLVGRFSSIYKGGVYVVKSKDLVNFSTNPIPQITNGAKDDRDYNIGTGSCIKKDNTYHFFYTGVNNEGLFGEYTAAAVKATSDNLTNWTKQTSPVMAQAPSDFTPGEFRDPHVYYDDTRSKYVMLVSSVQRSTNKGAIVRYQSDDLNEWELIEPLLATTSYNPQDFEFQSDSEIPECADIFKMGDKWYLVFSRINRDIFRKTYYLVSDNPNGPWKINDNHNTFDGLYFYAAKTFSDGTNRYVSGWASTGQSFNSGGELDWGGALVTHKLVKQANGELYPTITDGLNNKFSQSSTCKAIKQEGSVSGSDNAFTVDNGKVVFNRNPSSFKIELKIDASDAVGNFGIAFGAYEDQEDAYSINFDLTTTNQFAKPVLTMADTGTLYNFTPLIVPTDKIFNVKIVVERSLAVMYVNDNVAFTNRISNMTQNPWMIFSEGGEVKFSDIKVYK